MHVSWEQMSPATVARAVLEHVSFFNSQKKYLVIFDSIVKYDYIMPHIGCQVLEEVGAMEKRPQAIPPRECLSHERQEGHRKAGVQPCQIATAIIVEASLSFLGLGTQPPIPSWGWDLKANVSWIQMHPWLALAPGCAIFITVLGFNLFGDGLRDALDPRLKYVLPLWHARASLPIVYPRGWVKNPTWARYTGTQSSLTGPRVHRR